MEILAEDQLEEVAGGLLVAGAIAGAIVGGYGPWHSGGNAGQIVAGAILGGVGGFYGGVGMWGSAVATGVFSSFAGGGGRWVQKPTATK
jgi:hypothetical protein